MEFRQFDDWQPKGDAQIIIQAALEAYEEMKDFEPTLRTIYYQLVSGEDKVILNKQTEYKRLGSILTKARNAGLFPWDALQDKGRVIQRPYIKERPEDALYGIEYHLSLDFWRGQETYVEVWVEKQAQEGVVKQSCGPLKVHWLSCKGYLSATAAYDGGQRFAAAREQGKHCVLIHLGDHDPSGIDMTRDNGERIEKYGEMHDVEVNRIALNMSQVEEFNLPPDPAKLSDSRAQRYIERHGNSSWELDAIKPQVLKPILDDAINQYVDHDLMDEVKAEQRELRLDLEHLGDNAQKYLDIAREDRLED